MFKYRAISFPILIALLAVMIFWPSWGKYLFSIVAGLAAGMMLYEMGAMLEKIGIRSFVKSAAILGGVFLGAALLTLCLQAESIHSIFQTGRDRVKTVRELCFLLALFCFLAMVYCGWGMLLFRKEKKEILELSLSSAGILMLGGIPVAALSMIYFTGGQGPVTLFFVMMVTKSMDTGGYIFGMLSGKYLPGGNHKIVPSISPKKSWEGTVGGVVLSVGVSLLFYWLFCSRRMGINAPLGWYIAAGVFFALGSFAGDLTESALKRTCGVKDSGHWIPGMGGAFDVLDSFIYNGVLFWLLKFFID
ncbi:MAG: phosphatidate cytidylyltransferase [Lentisphaeria bacterium]|nr:phosphatidate cytidylyltransferase [Lentisphaeria bacterium]